jgi:hypothetical protein
VEHAQSTQTDGSVSIPESTANGQESLGAPRLTDEAGPIPAFSPASLDPRTGRMLPISDAERNARRDAALRMLKVLDQITDESDTDEQWREVYWNIDAARPHRPLFEGLY